MWVLFFFFFKHIYLLPLNRQYLGKNRLKLQPIMFLSFQKPYRSQGGETLSKRRKGKKSFLYSPSQVGKKFYTPWSLVNIHVHLVTFLIHGSQSHTGTGRVSHILKNRLPYIAWKEKFSYDIIWLVPCSEHYPLLLYWDNTCHLLLSTFHCSRSTKLSKSCLFFVPHKLKGHHPPHITGTKKCLKK